MQRRGAIGFHARADGARIKHGAEQTLVRVDVADAAHEGLIEQKSLHARAPRAESLYKLRFRDFQGLRTKILQSRRDVTRHFDASKHAGIAVTQLVFARIERKYAVRVRRTRF